MWTVADQALASASNIATGVVAAKALDRQAFGAFGLAFVIYTLAVGLTRAFVTEPLVSLYSIVRTDDSMRPVLRAATGAATDLGIAMAIVVGIMAAALGGVSWIAMGGLALVLPTLVLQDAWRFCFVAWGRPRAAVVNDAIWCATQAVSLGILLTMTHLTLLTIVLWWGGSGAAAGILGCVQAAAIPKLRSSTRWIREHRQLSWRYAADFAIATGYSQVTLLALGAVAGLAALGAIRGALVFFGPIVVLFGGTYLALGAEGARLKNVPRRLRRMMVYASCVLFLVAMTSLLLGLAIPSHIGRTLFGDTWIPARAVVVPVGLAVLGNCVAAGAVVGLRALAAAKATLRGRLAVAPVAVVAPLIGAMSGARGFAVGMAIASWFGALIWWRQFSRALIQNVKHPTRADQAGSVA